MDIAARWLRAPLQTRTIFAIAGLILTITGAASFARADGEVALMNRVIAALRSNERLNGAKAYTAAPGVVVLYGMVFDDKDRALPERTANGVNGVAQVVDNLRTKTGKWLREEERINTQLLTNGFNDVQVRVVGPEVYLSGQVASQSEKQRAASVVASVSSLQITTSSGSNPARYFRARRHLRPR
jgi:osmotically-inducible protein OsmY